MDLSFEEVCKRKQNKDNGYESTWMEIAMQFGLNDKYGNPDGERARNKWKHIRRKYGVLQGLYSKDKLKILHISDTHVPFNLPIEIYKDYINKVDILLLNGDIQDCQSISKFVKKFRKPFIDELILTRQFIIDLINYIKPKKVVINYGNHEARLLNALDNNLSNEFMALMPKSSMGLICETGFWNYDHENKTKTFYDSLVNVFKNKNIEIQYTNNWWVRIGNGIFAHPSAYSKNILKTAENAYLYFLQNGEEPFNHLILAHTHQQGFSRYMKCFLYESGCCCDYMDYLEAKLKKPASQGFLFIVQDNNGDIVYDESKIICL